MTKEIMDATVMALPGAPSSLCFNKDEFMKPNFYAENFLVECRRKVPLETLRDDLGMYLKILQSAMIELINKDYADFVNLSTNLVGMDKAINNLMHPLGQLKQDVLKVKTEMDEAINAVQGKLRHQAEIKEKQTALGRLRSIIHSVEKMEKLLGIQKSEDSVVQYPSELNGQLIERVATQFNKLQFFVNKSRGQQLVEEIKPRIANITTTLQYSLEGSFRKGLETNDTNILRQCLRTYTTIDKMRDAENLFRQHSVRPYMEEVINEEFLSKQGLKGMYLQVLDFVPNYCKILQEVTSGNIPGGGEVVRGYDFIVNSIWPEIVTNIEAQVPSIFAPGNPNVFHERYVCSMEFIERFESLCGSQASVKRLRIHPSYNTFMSKWSLPVYFQIRFQDIAGYFESTLTLPVITSKEGSKFQLQCSECLWYCLHQCWNPDVYLPALCHRFWKLSLQLLARYSRWLVYVGENHLVKQEIKLDNTTTALKNGAGEPIINGEINGPSNPVLSVGDIVLLLSDIYKLHDELPGVYKNVITPLLSQLNFQDTCVLSESLGEAQQVLLSSIVKCEYHLTQEITGQCATQLKNVSDIPRLYRRTNREKPSKATAYVEAMVKPVRTFHDEHSNIVKEEKYKEWISVVLKSICQQYLTITTDVLTSVKKMEESLKRLKQKKKSEVKGLSDDDKIRLQLQLDIIEFGNQIEAMDINKASIGYDELFTVVKNATGASQ